MTLGPANMAPFSDWAPFEDAGIRHTVFRAGQGPGVLLMHELPGMSPSFWRLANWLAERFTVYAPDLFGDDGTPTRPGNYLFAKACISREIHLFRNNDPGPITQWLRALARALHTQTGGPGVGVIGMCMTGNFALTLALDPWVTAPVASQPALPLSSPLRNRDGGLQMTDAEKRDLAGRDVDVMALRFNGDKFCKAARFAAIEAVVGKARFQSHTLDDKHQNPERQGENPHSVLTADLVDGDDSVTKQKLEGVIDFIASRIEA